MQADRLLSLLFLLQARGRMSAAALARELEVSKRTIYRDVDALSAAGVPVYAERGRAGGCALLPGYRTDVSGMTSAEARALFVFAGRGVPGQLGLDDAVRSGLRKLLATLPAGQRPEAIRAQERVVVDPHGWMRGQDELPHLATIQEAVWQDRKLRLGYRSADAPAAREIVVDPFGLLAKAGVWYLIAAVGGEPLLFRVSRVESAEKLGDAAERPAALDLEALWTRLRTRFETRAGSGYATRVRVQREILPLVLRLTAGRTLEPPVVDRHAGADDRAEVRMLFPAEGAAVASLLGFGAAVEAVEPAELRARLRRTAEEVASLYASGSTPVTAAPAPSGVEPRAEPGSRRARRPPRRRPAR